MKAIKTGNKNGQKRDKINKDRQEPGLGMGKKRNRQKRNGQKMKWAKKTHEV
jgi:hypothetical protein